MQSGLLPSIETTLESYHGRKIYFDPLKGNNGDQLIELGSRHALERFAIVLVDTPRQADLIIINGGAAMTKVWYHGFATLEKYNQGFPDVPLLILPTTFEFDGVDFGKFFAERRSPAWLYARERFSFEQLKNASYPCEVSLGLDHDMAFHLRGTSFLDRLLGTTKENHILIVERGDKEASTEYREAALAPSNIGKVLKSAMPSIVKAPIKRWVLNRQAAKTIFVRDTMKRLLAMHPDLVKQPLFAADISRKDAFSFNQFCRVIADANVVVTTRLHVAILGAMLGKLTYIQPGKTEFPKIREIYNFSLSESANVHML